MRRHFLFGSALLAGLLAIGCNDRERPTGAAREPDRDTETAERAQVRFVNADPNRPALDLWFGDNKTFSNIAYKTATDYMPVPAERRNFKVTVAGQTTELSTNSEGLSANGRYTFVALPTDDGGTKLTALNDVVNDVEPGKAKVRFVHAAPEAGELDVNAVGQRDPLFDAVDPSTATTFKDVDPALRGMEIRRDDRKGAATKVADLKLEAGKAYTIIVAGRKGVLETIKLENMARQETARR
jgi:hypothetical protein